MPWFAAHAIMYVRFKDGRQDPYPVWENVLLIEAADFNGAESAARDLARQDEGDADGTFCWQDRPATWVFAGLRKTLRVAHRGSTSEPASGDEITYSEFSVPNEDALRRLAAGDTVVIEYVE